MKRLFLHAPGVLERFGPAWIQEQKQTETDASQPPYKGVCLLNFMFERADSHQSVAVAAPPFFHLPEILITPITPPFFWNKFKVIQTRSCRNCIGTQLRQQINVNESF